LGQKASARMRYEVRPVFLLGSSDELWVDPRPYLLFSASLGRNHDPTYMKELCLAGNLFETCIAPGFTM